MLDRTTFPSARLAVAASGLLLLASACATSEPGDADTLTDTVSTSDGESTVATAEPSTTPSDASDATTDGATADEATANSTSTTDVPVSTDATTTTDSPTTADPAAGCDEVAAQFATRGSANPELDDPEVSASCDGDEIVVTSNGIPDYTYVETSPGQPRDQDNTFTIPASPEVAESVTEIPSLGTAAVSLGGIQIFGPTEGTGGDVESLPGILSDCGSHNGPSGFHIHLILTSSETDCLFTPEEVEAEPQLVGYAFDGFPIYTGADRYTSSWQLTDESLFATDTWAAHSYVEGSGDLDQCNGLTDENGDYAYYTTSTFPYVLGCYTGVVDLDAAGGGGGGGGGGGADVDGERSERPERDDEVDQDRPARPERDDGVDQDRPARPDEDEQVEAVGGADR